MAKTSKIVKNNQRKERSVFTPIDVNNFSKLLKTLILHMMKKEKPKKRLLRCQEMLLQQDIEIGVKLQEGLEVIWESLVCPEIRLEI